MNLRAVAPLILIAYLLCANCGTREPTANDVETPPSFSAAVESASTIPFCELIRDPSGHDKQLIRTTAEFSRNLENAYLFDRACGGASASVWVELDPAYVYTKPELKKKFEQIYCSKQPCPTARIIAVGRFDGSADASYGHFGCLPLEILNRAT